jgi:hypothetical protein
MPNFPKNPQLSAAPRALRIGCPPRDSLARSARIGCTLVELVLALFVFGFGALALAGASAIVLRRLTLAHVNVSSANSAASRFAMVASSRCGSLSAGSAHPLTGLAESWTVGAAGSGYSRVVVTLQFSSQPAAQVFEATVPCL